MKIAILTTLYPPITQGGAERAAALLAEALVRNGDSVVVITLHPAKETLIEDRNGVRVYRLPIDNIYWPFTSKERPTAVRRLLWHLRDAWNRGAAKRVAAVLDIERPEVLHSHSICGFSIAVWKEARKRKIRVIHTTHDYYLLCLRSDMFGQGSPCSTRCMQCRIGRLAHKHCSNKIDTAISVSQFVLDAHKSAGYFKEAITHVEKNVSPRIDLPHASHLPTVTPDLIFGFIGRIEKQKGIEVLLEASRLLIHTNWSLRIAGTGRLSSIEVLKRAYPDPRIEWLGHIQASIFYATVDVVIVPSIWADPFPYVAIEALQAGKGLIFARSGGIPEIAMQGKIVASYSAGDMCALAAAMDHALDQPSCWRNGGFRDDADEASFSPEVVVERHKLAYFADLNGLSSNSPPALCAADELPQS